MANYQRDREWEEILWVIIPKDAIFIQTVPFIDHLIWCCALVLVTP